MDIKTKAFNQAINTLKALGAQFKVIAADGQEYGELEVVVPKARTRRHDVYASTNHLAKIQAMQIGEVEVLTAPEGEDVKKFRSAVCGAAGRFFGNGNYVTSVNSDGAVELLCIGRDEVQA